MLYRLEIENFYSIRLPQTVDLRIREGVPEEPGRFDALFPGSAERAARVVAFFGPNASGKSTVLRALMFLRWFILHSFQASPTASLPCDRFNSSEARDVPIRLAVEFSGPLDFNFEDLDAPQGAWRYELTLKYSEDRIVVATEALRQRRQGIGKWSKVFERIGSEVTGGKSFGLSGFSMILDKVRENASLISTLAQFDHKPSLSLYEAASTIVGNILIERSELSDRDASEYYARNPEVMEALNREIQRIDLGIKSVFVHNGSAGPVAFFIHEGLEHPMPWTHESHGTRSFMKYFPLLHLALNSGGVAVIDEMDVSIHPLVLPEVIRWFHDDVRNPKRAQLWITCHAASLLEDLLKEEVFFCEKDSVGRTTIYGLQDVKSVRRTDNRYRKYLSGVYGSVPRIG